MKPNPHLPYTSTIRSNGVNVRHEVEGLVFNKHDSASGAVRPEIYYYNVLTDATASAFEAGLRGNIIVWEYQYGLIRFGEIIGDKCHYLPLPILKQRFLNGTACRAEKRRMKSICAYVGIDPNDLRMHSNEV